MPLPTYLLAALSLSCASLTQADVDAAPAVAAVADDLPAATEGLAIPQFEAEGVTLADLVRDFARVTSQHVVMTEATRSAMQHTPVVVGGASEIPPSEVYAFVEGLLYFHGFFTAQLKGGAHPLLGVYSGREVALAPRKAVAAAELVKYAGHPAFLIQTVIDLPHVDVRQLTTSLRGMLRDTSSQSLLAVGDHGVALAGTGQFVSELARISKEIDDQSRAAWERRAEARRESPESGGAERQEED